MVEIEQFLKAEKREGDTWVIQLNPVMTEFVKLLAVEHHLTEREVVENLLAGGVDIAYREEEGKQIIIKDPTDGPDKILRLFKKNSA